MRGVIYNEAPWTVEQDPTMAGNDRLVRFLKHNGQRKLLDQVAEWEHGGGWNARRWVPKHPQVPQKLLTLVEIHMRHTDAVA